tara:strand:+ start:122 stop:973 length:852 start_codon:yes stop_codon:yes gene_type:complete
VSNPSQKAGLTFLREQRYPFLRIASTGVKRIAQDIAYTEYTKRIALTGWLVKYWPPTVSTPGSLACSPYDAQDSGELDNDMVFDINGVSPTPPSDRNVSTQCFKTAGEIILMLNEQGWTGVRIIDGSALMKWCMWAMCRVNGIDCVGYEPDDDNDALGRYERAQDLLNHYDQRQPSFDPGLVYGSSAGPDEFSEFDFPDITDDVDLTAGAGEVEPMDTSANPDPTTDDANIDPKTDPGPNLDTGPDTGPDTGLDNDLDPDTHPDTQPDTHPNNDPDPDTDPDT